MTRRLPLELLAALAAILGVTAWYAALARRGPPAPGSRIGLALAIIGFLLMLATQFLYTLRKQWHGRPLGSTRLWLQAHIFTGLLGPWLVLLHTAGRFNGLAGLVAWLTVLMVLSGFIGRYIYTAAPRSVDGDEMSPEGMLERLTTLEEQASAVNHPLAREQPPRGWWALVLGPLLRRSYRRRVESALPRRLSGPLIERFDLLMRVDALIVTRRMLALWHLFHVPLGVTLFVLATLHIAAALYYGTFSR